jgi:hypothetical protein
MQIINAVLYFALYHTDCVPTYNKWIRSFWLRTSTKEINPIKIMSLEALWLPKCYLIFWDQKYEHFRVHNVCIHLIKSLRLVANLSFQSHLAYVVRFSSRQIVIVSILLSRITNTVPTILVTVPPKAEVRNRSIARIAGSIPKRPLVCIVYVAASVTCWSFMQRIPIGCG